MIALFPVVFTSMMLILHPRIGGPATAAVIANGGWGLIGFGIAIAVLHVAALPVRLGRRAWSGAGHRAVEPGYFSDCGGLGRRKPGR